MLNDIWNAIGLKNDDGTISTSDKNGNELLINPDRTWRIIPGGFVNSCKLVFVDGDGLEYLIMREVDDTYYLDSVNLTKDSVVVDIGAHVGVVSMMLAKKYGCHVEAYEPAPNNYRRLVANIKANGLDELITPHNLAVTHDGRDVEIGGPGAESTGGMTIYHGLYPNPGTPFTPVKSVTLKDIVGDRQIDLLKIDCEAAEHEIFIDLEPLKQIRAIRGEFHDLITDKETFTQRRLLQVVQSVVPDTKVDIL